MYSSPFLNLVLGALEKVVILWHSPHYWWGLLHVQLMCMLSVKAYRLLARYVYYHLNKRGNIFHVSVMHIHQQLFFSGIFISNLQHTRSHRFQAYVLYWYRIVYYPSCHHRDPTHCPFPYGAYSYLIQSCIGRVITKVLFYLDTMMQSLIITLKKII